MHTHTDTQTHTHTLTVRVTTYIPATDTPPHSTHSSHAYEDKTVYRVDTETLHNDHSTLCTLQLYNQLATYKERE